MLTQLILILLICQKTAPSKIYMRDGRWLANAQPLTWHQGALIYERHGQRYRLPPSAVDLAKTLRPKPKPKPKTPRPNAIPWSDPAFARKTQATKRVHLTDDGLTKFAIKHPYVADDAADEKAASEDEPASADTFSSLPELQLGPDWNAKPPKRAAKANKEKRSKRKSKAKKAAPPPEDELEDPLWFEAPATDEQEQPLDEEVEPEAPS